MSKRSPAKAVAAVFRIIMRLRANAQLTPADSNALADAVEKAVWRDVPLTVSFALVGRWKSTLSEHRRNVVLTEAAAVMAGSRRTKAKKLHAMQGQLYVGESSFRKIGEGAIREIISR